VTRPILSPAPADAAPTPASPGAGPVLAALDPAALAMRHDPLVETE
jgi:hypothetical protein